MKNFVIIMAQSFPGEGVTCQGDSSVYANLTFDGTPRTEAELDTLYLELLKTERKLQVDQRTGELIAEGFTFDGTVFSLSTESQINWSGLKTLEDILTWPMDISVKGDGEYELAEADLLGFLGAGATVIQTSVGSGRALKISLAAAADEAALDAITDDR